MLRRTVPSVVVTAGPASSTVSSAVPTAASSPPRFPPVSEIRRPDTFTSVGALAPSGSRRSTVIVPAGAMLKGAAIRKTGDVTASASPSLPSPASPTAARRPSVASSRAVRPRGRERRSITGAGAPGRQGDMPVPEIRVTGTERALSRSPHECSPSWRCTADDAPSAVRPR